MTPQELDLLAAILPWCDHATLAFCLASEPAAETSWLSIWSSIGKTFQQCRQRLAQLPDCKINIEILNHNPQKSRFARNPILEHLEQGWSRPTPKFKIQHQNSKFRPYSCLRQSRSRGRFCRARNFEICPDDGGRFRDAAVLVRSLDGYHKPLERAFRRYGIPFFLDRREFVAHHPLAELTRSALRTVTFDWPHDDWFAALKAGFSPVDETEIDRLENEALARGWHGAKWREPVQIADNR